MSDDVQTIRRALYDLWRQKPSQDHLGFTFPEVAAIANPKLVAWHFDQAMYQLIRSRAAETTNRLRETGWTWAHDEPFDPVDGKFHLTAWGKIDEENYRRRWIWKFFDAVRKPEFARNVFFALVGSALTIAANLVLHAMKLI